MLAAMSRHGRLKLWQQVALFLATIYFLLFHLLPAIHSFCYTSAEEQRPEILDPRRHGPLYSYSTALTTNLIIASTAKDNITWTSDLFPHLPNLKIYQYVSDSPTAEFHPAVPNKGREALMYLTFLRDFHHLARTPPSTRRSKHTDNANNSDDQGLADINIFIHAEESPWHADSALLKSMLFTLSHLDLEHVQKNGYVNLRTTWSGSGKQSCPGGGFNTSITFAENPRGEESFMREAFEKNFPGEVVPEILAGPCCSQFAVTREAIRKREREVYERTVDWLVGTVWPDQLAGRVWEHMWIWLFKGVAKDCGKGEWRTLCTRYGVCFEESFVHKRYEELWAEREKLKEDEFGFWRELLRPGRVQRARDMVQVIGGELEEMLVEAVKRGRDQPVRKASEDNQVVESEGHG